MANNKGKVFEDVVKKAFLKVPDVSIDRFRDAPKKLKNVDNPSDFVVYKFPHELYVECKSHKGNTLPFSCVREEQIKGMSQKALLKGVTAGLIIWYIDHDLTVWVPIDVVLTLINFGHKSINVKDLDKLPHLVICGKKKRVYFDYDMEKFFNDLYGVK